MSALPPAHRLAQNLSGIRPIVLFNSAGPACLSQDILADIYGSVLEAASYYEVSYEAAVLDPGLDYFLSLLRVCLLKGTL